MRQAVRRGAMAGLALAVLAPAFTLAGAKPAPVAVYLEPIDPAVVEGLAVRKVEESLRARLGRRKPIVLVDDPEKAAVTLSLVQCAGWGEKRRVSEAGDRVFFRPGTETSYGVRTENRSYIVMVVRATEGGRFTDLASHEGDRTLKAASDSVADQLVKIVRPD